MKPETIHLSISPVSTLSSDGQRTPTFRNPFTPGCPTDSNLYYQQRESRQCLQTPLSAFMTIPRTATTTTRRSSLVLGGPTMGFDNAYEEIHDPTRVEQWRIQPGTFVAFELDTEFVADRLEASCEAYPELLGKEAVRDVRVFPKGRYLGLVLWSHTYTVDASEDMGESLDDGEGSDGLEGAKVVEELVVNFVSPTPPPAPHQSRCVPIGTFASGSEHAPLQTTTLFPFPGMLQWTTFGTRLEVRSVCDSALHFKLKEDEFERFDERVADDYRASISKRLTQGCKDAEDEAIERLKVPTYTLPAKIWRDVREARRSSSLASAQGPCSLKEAGKSGVMHPVSFAEEVEALSRLIANYDAACCDALDSSVA